MAPHQKDRDGGRLILDSLAEIERLNDVIRKAQTKFCEDGTDGKIAADMFRILAAQDVPNTENQTPPPIRALP